MNGSRSWHSRHPILEFGAIGMRDTRSITGFFSLILTAAGCASMPEGPSVVVLPGSGANFEQFCADDHYCRDFALQQLGGQSPADASTNSALSGAAVGAGLGAIAGALIGGGRGAAVGAGTGLLAGTLFGSAAANQTYRGAQYSYDGNYIQCMYAKGHRVPVYGTFERDSYRYSNENYRGPPDYSENRQG
ncbi:MAG: YMGG-like glycine zipper-containing protein, partial [Methylococcales bacterium]